MEVDLLRPGGGLIHNYAFPLTPGLVHLIPDVRLTRQYYLVGRRQDGSLFADLFEILQVKLSQEIARLRALFEASPG